MTVALCCCAHFENCAIAERSQVELVFELPTRHIKLSVAVKEMLVTGVPLVVAVWRSAACRLEIAPRGTLLNELVEEIK